MTVQLAQAPTAARRGVLGSPRPAAVAAVVSGAVTAIQVQANGGLGRHLGSAVDAAAVSFLLGWVLLFGIVYGIRRHPKAGRPAPVAPARVPAPRWAYLAGLGGATYVSIAAWAAPRVGVALVAIATVAGQSLGGLLADAAGLGAGGRRRPARGTLAGAALAVLAVAFTHVDHLARVEVALLVVLGAGAAIGIQSALLGRLTRAHGDPFTAALINFTVGSVALVAVVTAGVLNGDRVGGWPAQPWLYAGGLCGAIIIALMSSAVPRLGALRFTVAFTAGQLATGVLIDVLAPHGAGLTGGRVAGVLTITAATLLALGRHRRPARTGVPAGTGDRPPVVTVAGGTP